MSTTAGSGGSGPLYEHTPAGEAAAEEEVHIPGSATGDRDPEEGSDPDQPSTT